MHEKKMKEKYQLLLIPGSDLQSCVLQNMACQFHQTQIVDIPECRLHCHDNVVVISDRLLFLNRRPTG